MRTFLLIAIILFSFNYVLADTTSTAIGNTTYFSGDNQGTATKTGSYIYYNINGERGNQITIGKTTYFNGELFSKQKED